MRIRVLVALVLVFLLGASFFVLKGDDDTEKKKKEGVESQSGAQPEPRVAPTEVKIHKPAKPEIADSESRELLLQELLHRVRLTRERRIRDAIASEDRIVDSLSDLRSFYNECHAIAATTDLEIGDTAAVMVKFDVTKRTVVAEVLAEADEVVNADFVECVEETTKALDPQPADGVRNVSMLMEFDFSR